MARAVRSPAGCSCLYHLAALRATLAWLTQCANTPVHTHSTLFLQADQQHKLLPAVFTAIPPFKVRRMHGCRLRRAGCAGVNVRMHEEGRSS